jgi:hypothetical protein
MCLLTFSRSFVSQLYTNNEIVVRAIPPAFVHEFVSLFDERG